VVDLQYVSMNVKNDTARALISRLFRNAHCSFMVVEHTPTKRLVSMSLAKVPFQQALERVLTETRPEGYEARWVEGICVVSRSDSRDLTGTNSGPTVDFGFYETDARSAIDVLCRSCQSNYALLSPLPYRLASVSVHATDLETALWETLMAINGNDRLQKVSMSVLRYDTGRLYTIVAPHNTGDVFGVPVTK
jgi:hypothetical protein